MTTIVDSNVLMDVLSPGGAWFEWSSHHLAAAADAGRVGINPIIYAEVSAGFERIEDVELALGIATLERFPLPWDAAFLAGVAFRQYRGRGGSRRLPLPDFYIGAHAAVAGYALLTRDAVRYRMYFPRLELIAPD